MHRFSHYRWQKGRIALREFTRIGRWAAEEVARLNPDICYVFTHVGLETLIWAKSRGVPALLDSGMGHIANVREVLEREHRRWFRGGYRGDPIPETVARIENEYALADRIRATSPWMKQSFVARGIDPGQVKTVGLPIDLAGWVPPDKHLPTDGPLRVLYVGSLDLRKGFLHLLNALGKIGSESARLEIVGSTGTREMKNLLRQATADLPVKMGHGNPLSAYQRAEVFVSPSLEDGFGFAIAEAMACGLPVIATDQCGAAELIRPGINGWIVPAGNAEALAGALRDAMASRPRLREMGRAARAEVERFNAINRFAQLRDWVYGTVEDAGFEISAAGAN